MFLLSDTWGIHIRRKYCNHAKNQCSIFHEFSQPFPTTTIASKSVAPIDSKISESQVGHTPGFLKGGLNESHAKSKFN